MWLDLLLLSAAYALLITFQIHLLLKPPRWRDTVVTALLLLPALIYSYGLVLDVQLPNPSTALEQLFRPLAQKLGLG